MVVLGWRARLETQGFSVWNLAEVDGFLQDLKSWVGVLQEGVQIMGILSEVFGLDTESES